MEGSVPPPDSQCDAQDEDSPERAEVSSKRKKSSSPRDAPKRVAHNRAERQRTLRLRAALQRLREAAGCQEVDRASIIAAAAARLEELQSQYGPGNLQHGQQSERLALLDKLDLGICVLDAAGIIVGANQSFVDFMCCSFQELQQQPSIFTRVNTDSAAELSKAIALLQTAVQAENTPVLFSQLYFTGRRPIVVICRLSVLEQEPSLRIAILIDNVQQLIYKSTQQPLRAPIQRPAEPQINANCHPAQQSLAQQQHWVRQWPVENQNLAQIQHHNLAPRQGAASVIGSGSKSNSSNSSS